MSNYFGAMGTALYAKLAGGTALIAELGGTLIWQGHPPDGQARPYVLFNHQAGGPDNQNSHDMRDNLWYVRGYASTPAKASALDQEIEDLLHRNSLSVSGYTNFWLTRQDDFATDEVQPNNERIYGRGAFYRVRLTGS